MSLTKEQLMFVMDTIANADAGDAKFLSRALEGKVQATAELNAEAPKRRGRPAGSKNGSSANAGGAEAGANGNGEGNPNPADLAGGPVEFTEGQPVIYMKKRGDPQRGVVAKLSGKTIIFRSETGDERRVSPEQLQPVAAAAEGGASAGAMAQGAGTPAPEAAAA